MLCIYPLHTMFYMFFGFYNSVDFFFASNITFKTRLYYHDYSRNNYFYMMLLIL